MTNEHAYLDPYALHLVVEFPDGRISSVLALASIPTIGLIRDVVEHAEDDDDDVVTEDYEDEDM